MAQKYKPLTEGTAKRTSKEPSDKPKPDIKVPSQKPPRINRAEIKRVRARLREMLRDAPSPDDDYDIKAFFKEVNDLRDAALQAIPEVSDIAKLARKIERDVY